MSSHQKNSTRFLRWNKKAFCPSKKQYGPGYLGANRFRENKKAPLWRFFLSVFFSCIFIFRSHSTPDVPLLFIGIHQLFDLPVKLWVYFFQPLRYNFMYGAFADVKRFRRTAYSGIILYHIQPQRNRPFLRQPFQSNPSLRMRLPQRGNPSCHIICKESAQICRHKVDFQKGRRFCLAAGVRVLF